MNTDTKVADLPAKWRAKAKRIRGMTAGSDLAADIMDVAAEDLEAALARQEADNASSPNVIYRWRALDYSGFCYGSNPPHDLPSEACLTAFYRDPEGLRSALHEISATGNMTATDKQFSRHLQQIARDALAGAAPPSAPVGQEWTDEQCIEFASCAFRNAPRNPPEGVELTDIRMAASRVMRSAPPAAQTVDLGQFRGAVEAYKAAVNEDCYFDPSDYDDNIAYADRLLALIDQQAGKEMR